jgi:hypothetical protein
VSVRALREAESIIAKVGLAVKPAGEASVLWEISGAAAAMIPSGACLCLAITFSISGTPSEFV